MTPKASSAVQEGLSAAAWHLCSAETHFMCSAFWRSESLAEPGAYASAASVDKLSVSWRVLAGLFYPPCWCFLQRARMDDLKAKADEVEADIKAMKKAAAKQLADGSALKHAMAAHEAAVEELRGRHADIIEAAQMQQAKSRTLRLCN